MDNVSVSDIIVATKGKMLFGKPDELISDICINSNNSKSGDLFVPLIGERTDGHLYINDALQKCSVTLSMREIAEVEDKTCILVDDTLVALQRIGEYIRNQYSIPIVAVTGSVGKTTVRSMIAHALKCNFQVLETEKNYNSQIGVPIMLSKLKNEHEIAVLECGMSEQGQITRLSNMVKPKHAVISQIGVAHIEHLKTQENILKEKLSIIDGMNNDGILFLNGEDKHLVGLNNSLNRKIIYYGMEEWCDYYAKDIQFQNGCSIFRCVHNDEAVYVKLPVPGKHNVVNCVGAIAVATTMGISLEMAADSFTDYCGVRQQIVKLENGCTVIDDAYNASPDSVKASLTVLCDIESSGRRIAVLGDMLELGNESSNYHYEVGEFLATLPIDELCVVGTESLNIKKAVDRICPQITTRIMKDNSEIANYISKNTHKGDIVLIKGSNGMKMYDIYAEITEAMGREAFEIFRHKKF